VPCSAQFARVAIQPILLTTRTLQKSPLRCLSLQAVLAGRGELSLSDLPRLVVAEACFKEALRLHPPVGMINRWGQLRCTVF
jgi:cytochrome P450